MSPSEAEKHGYERTSKHPKSTKFGRQNPIAERWNSEEQLVEWRKAWADVTNRYLEQYGHDVRIDHRSHAERGLTEQSAIHEGVVARAMEAKGIISDRCEMNRQIKADNALLRELRASVKKLMNAVKNTIPSLAEAMESLRAKMIIFCYQLRHIRKGKHSISNYVDAAAPVLERYAELKQEIKEKSSEQKSLRSEKKVTSVFNVKKQMELSQRIATLTEDLEELRSERTMLLNQLDCADDVAVKKVKTSVSNMKDTLKNLEASEKKFAAELDAAQKEFAALQEQAADFDPIALYDVRQAIRPDKEQNAVRRLQDAYGDKYNAMAMLDSKRDISLKLDEYAENRAIQQMKREHLQKIPTEHKEKHCKKNRIDHER